MIPILLQINFLNHKPLQIYDKTNINSKFYVNYFNKNLINLIFIGQKTFFYWIILIFCILPIFYINIIILI